MEKIEFIESYIKVQGGDYQWNDNHGVLIRCENCQFHDSGKNEIDIWNRCRLHSMNTDDDEFCSWAVKKS